MLFNSIVRSNLAISFDMLYGVVLCYVVLFLFHSIALRRTVLCHMVLSHIILYYMIYMVSHYVISSYVLL